MGAAAAIAGADGGVLGIEIDQIFFDEAAVTRRHADSEAGVEAPKPAPRRGLGRRRDRRGVRAKGRREASASGQQKTRPVWATAGHNCEDANFIAYRTGG